MIKIKIAIAMIVISIVGIIVNCPGLAIPNAQSTSDEGIIIRNRLMTVIMLRLPMTY